MFEVRDDGPGFDMKESSSRGLLNMRDRVSALGGELEIASVPGVGTRVRGRLPDRGRRTCATAAAGWRGRVPACG